MALGIPSLLASDVDAGQYFQDYSSLEVGATNLNDGSQLFSTAPSNSVGVAPPFYKALQLSAQGSNWTHSAVLLPLLDTGDVVHAFSVVCSVRVYGDFSAGAGDGFSFTFGSLDGLDLSSTDYEQESGYGTGLTFSARSSSTNQPGFYVYVHGVQVAALSHWPPAVWGNEVAKSRLLQIDWHQDAGLSVRLDNNFIFLNVPTHGFIPSPGDRLAWAARTSDLSEEIQLDNMVVVTRALLSRVFTTDPYASSSTNGSYFPSRAFDDVDASSARLTSQTGWIEAAVWEPTQVRAYMLTPSTFGPPESFHLQGFDGVSWQSSASGRVYFQVYPETRTFMSVDNGAYQAFRLNFTSPIPYGVLAELRLYEAVPVTNSDPLEPLALWRFSKFGTLKGLGSAADESDPDGDRNANLMEYATGSDPEISNTASFIELDRTNGVALLFDRNTAATDATIYVESAAALTNDATWQGIATNRNGSWGGATNVTEGGGNPAAVSVTDPQPGTNRFLRLRVTHP